MLTTRDSRHLVNKNNGIHIWPFSVKSFVLFLQHNLLLKTDEATKELELKAKPIMKELPLISAFSEEDRVQMLTGIDKSIKKLKEKRELIEMAESKLNRQMQVLLEYTPDPTEDKRTILSKLQMSYDVVSGANDPDRARESVLKQLDPSSGFLQNKNSANQNRKPQTGQGGARTNVPPTRSNPKPQTPNTPKPKQWIAVIRMGKRS